MHIHEYQAKNLFKKNGIPVPPFFVASTVEEIVQGNKELSIQEGVVKVQIHAGGRGKAGGVKFAKTPEEVLRLAEPWFGQRIVTKQTGPLGALVEKVLVMPPVNIAKEYYLGIVIDRSYGAPVIIASPEGGVDIEEIAEKTPDRIVKIPLPIHGRIRRYQLLELAAFMGWKDDLLKQGMDLVPKLCKVFIENDASLLEINPLVLTKEGQLTVLDAKLTIDDNALFRQPAIKQWYDPTQETPQEVMAKEFNLSYIGLSGEIGCLVNGAGLAMATMDTIHHYGGKPANFLDIGGSATQEEIAHGFKILMGDSQVKAIFVNIFGGIMDCGVLAQGMIEALKGAPLKIPLVVRMEGTNVEKGKGLLKESGIPLILADTMADGAQKAIAAIKR